MLKNAVWRRQNCSLMHPPGCALWIFSFNFFHASCCRECQICCFPYHVKQLCCVSKNLDMLQPISYLIIYRNSYHDLIGLGAQFIIHLFDFRRGKEKILYLPKTGWELREEEGIRAFFKSFSDPNKSNQDDKFTTRWHSHKVLLTYRFSCSIGTLYEG